MCAPGDVIYTGSFVILNSGILGTISDDATAGFTAWRAIITENESGSATVRAFATCFNNPP